MLVFKKTIVRDKSHREGNQMSIILRYVIFCFVMILLLTKNSGSDTQWSIDDKIHTITTLVNINHPSPFGKSQGTGFFYHQFSEKDSTKNFQWLRIEKLFLVTNRHVILGSDSREIIPSELTFYLRKIKKDEVLWEPITLEREDIIERTRVHPNSEIDVCTIEVLDLVTNKVKSKYTTVS